MRSPWAWVRRAPLPQVFLYFMLAWAVLTFALAHRLSLVRAVAALIGGIFFATFMTAYTARQRSRDAAATGAAGTSDNSVDFDDAIKRGQIPADSGQWAAFAGLVERRQRQVQLMRWFGPVVFGLFTLLGVALTVAGPVWPNAVYIAVFLFFLIYTTRANQRLATRLTRVRQVLRERQTSG